MSAVDPHGELWFTRHQAERDPALAAREARLRHSVSRDVANACVDARLAAEHTVDAGRTIAKHRVDVRCNPGRATRAAGPRFFGRILCAAANQLMTRCVARQELANPRLPTQPTWPDANAGEEAQQWKQATMSEARRLSKQQSEADRKREEVRIWREKRDAEKAAQPVDGRSPRRGVSPRRARDLRDAGQKGVQAYVEKQAARQRRAQEVVRPAVTTAGGTWVVRESKRREVKELPEAGPGFREVAPKHLEAKPEGEAAEAAAEAAPDA